MSLITIILFFVYSWGLGYTATSNLKNSDNIFERNFMRLGIGLGVFIALGVILNLFHIPLDWKIFFILSILFPVYRILKGRVKVSTADLKFTKSNIYIFIVMLLFIFTFYMYHTGAFSYPYLEDDDPWEHARSVKYISIEKTVYEPAYAETDLFKYIGPYPPGYNIIMGVLHQTNDSMNWTLKFFNALIISLSIIIFYFFAKEFTKSRKKALIATFVLTVIPSYLSHFIWSHSLIPLLFFVVFYCLEMVETDRKWFWVAGISMSSIFLTSADQSIKFSFLFAVYLLVKWLMYRKLPIDYIKSAALGVLLSFSWWSINIVDMFKERVDRVSHLSSGLTSAETNIIYKVFGFMKNYFSPYSGSATRPYTFNDFFVAKSTNMINNPVGIGIAISLMAVISIILMVIFTKKYIRDKKTYPFIALGWFIILFLSVNSATFGIPGLLSFRSWMLLAIPVSIITAEGLVLIMDWLKKFSVPGTLVIVLFVAGAIFTSGIQKYEVNTAMWPPGAGWTSMEEVQLYLWVTNLPKNTNIMSFSGSGDMIGLDMANCDWCPGYIDFRKNFLNKTPEEVYYYLKENGYEYFILDARSVIYYPNQTQEEIFSRFNEFVGRPAFFDVAYQNKGGAILKVL